MIETRLFGAPGASAAVRRVRICFCISGCSGLTPTITFLTSLFPKSCLLFVCQGIPVMRELTIISILMFAISAFEELTNSCCSRSGRCRSGIISAVPRSRVAVPVTISITISLVFVTSIIMKITAILGHFLNLKAPLS